jgi:hypothetical protein
MSWAAGVSGDWSNALDWLPVSTPGSTDIATIGTTGTYTITVTVAESAQTLDLTAAGGRRIADGLLMAADRTVAWVR